MGKYKQPVVTPEEAEAAEIVLRAVLGKRILVEHDEGLLRGFLEAVSHAPVRDGAAALDPAANQLGKFAKRSPESRKAALANFPRSGTQRMRVLEAIQASGTGLTREEAGRRLRMPPNVVTPRILELVQGGWLAEKLDDETGARITRKTLSGVDAAVLVLTARAKGKLRGPEAVAVL